MPIASSVADLIGGTPLVRLNRVVGDCPATILGKLEAANPGNSVKDRIGLAMIQAAEASGELVPGKSTIVEPTSGNTGIALALVAATKGYPCVIVMPDTMSPERRATMRAFGAKIVLTEGAKGMRGAVETATKIAAGIEHAFMPQQFRNPANPDVSISETTARGDLERHGRDAVDALVAGVGHGRHDHGCRRASSNRRRRLSKRSPSSPTASPILSGGAPGPHKIQGIGPGFVPEVLETEQPRWRHHRSRNDDDPSTMSLPDWRGRRDCSAASRPVRERGRPPSNTGARDRRTPARRSSRSSATSGNATSRRSSSTTLRYDGSDARSAAEAGLRAMIRPR